MDKTPTLRMQLEFVRIAEETLSGRVITEGLPPRSFTGWIGLNAAIDATLAAARASAESDASR